MQRIIIIIEAFQNVLGRAIAWLTLGMVLVTFTVVVMRYLFDVGWVGMQESVTYMHATVFMAGAAFTLVHGGHVRVDIFYQRFSARTRAWIDLFGTLLLLVPLCIFIAWMSWEYISEAWELRESSSEAGGLPGVYLLKSLILVMCGLMLIEALATVLRAVLVIRNRALGEASQDGITT